MLSIRISRPPVIEFSSNISNEVASHFLLSFDGFKQGFEVTSTETREVIALNDLDEDCGTIKKVLQNYSLVKKYNCISTKMMLTFVNSWRR